MNPQILVINDQKFVLLSEEEYKALLSLNGLTNNPNVSSPISTLKKKREELNLTINKMSELLGVTPAQICRLEKGQKPNTKTKNLIKEKLGIDV